MVCCSVAISSTEMRAEHLSLYHSTIVLDSAMTIIYYHCDHIPIISSSGLMTLSFLNGELDSNRVRRSIFFRFFFNCINSNCSTSAKAMDTLVLWTSTPTVHRKADKQVALTSIYQCGFENGGFTTLAIRYKNRP